MNKPNRNMSLTKTNYFANLKRKANTKDEKEQAAFNKEVLNCITTLDAKIAKIEETLADLGEKHNGSTKAIGEFLNTQVVPQLNAIIDRLPNEGGETMDGA